MTVIHDLRNSLSAMKGYATLMIHDLQVDDKLYSCTSKILDCIIKVENLFHDIQSVARSGKVQYETGEVRKLIQMNVDAFQSSGQNSDITVETSYPPEAIFIRRSTEIFSRMVMILLTEMSSFYEAIRVHVKKVNGERVRFVFEGTLNSDFRSDVIGEVDSRNFKKTMNDVSFLIVKKIIEIHNGQIRFEIGRDLHESYVIEIPVVQERSLKT